MWGALPYRSLKPPKESAIEKTGLPTMTSFSTEEPPLVESLIILATSSSHSQPSRPTIWTSFSTFLALPATPSFTTLSAPPLT